MKKKAKLIIGRFYVIYGGVPHPSKIFMYDSKHKTYLSLKFGTTKVRHMTKIHPIQKGQNKQFVHNRPFEGVRSDYGEKELQGLETNVKDESIFDEIKKRKPVRTSKAKKTIQIKMPSNLLTVLRRRPAFASVTIKSHCETKRKEKPILSSHPLGLALVGYTY